MGYRAKGWLGAGVLIAVSSASGAIAQSEPMVTPTCDASAAPALPPELAGWVSPSPVAAAGDARGLDRALLTPGKAATVKLLPTPAVHYPLQPEKPGGSVSHGGLLGFTIAEAGTYRIALGSAAWIDVVRAGKAVISTAHGHGPACTTIRKMVDFPFTPGRYVLQVSANAGAELPVLVTRLR